MVLLIVHIAPLKESDIEYTNEGADTKREITIPFNIAFNFKLHIDIKIPITNQVMEVDK